MLGPAQLNLSANPAPTIKSQPVRLSYEDIRYAARTNALTDFVRERRYWQTKRDLVLSGKNVQVIAIAPDKADTLVRQSNTRLLKEHASGSWGAFFFQTSIFSLTGVSAVGTAMLLYLGVYHNRIFLPVAPIGMAVTWRLWGVLEEAWEQQRYVDNAARIREERRGNPMNAVVRRRRKNASLEEREEADVQVGGATDML